MLSEFQSQARSSDRGRDTPSSLPLSSSDPVSLDLDSSEDKNRAGPDGSVVVVPKPTSRVLTNVSEDGPWGPVMPGWDDPRKGIKLKDDNYLRGGVPPETRPSGGA